MHVSAEKRFAYEDCSVARVPWSIIHAACQHSSRAASIFVAMSAIMKLTPWFIAIGIPNWTRSFEYCAAYSYAARATPTAPIAVPGRVKSSVFMAILKPSPSSPRSEEHTSELQSHSDLVCRLLLEKKKQNTK